MTSIPLSADAKLGLVAMVAVGLLATAGGGGSFAYFSDTATSEGNSVSAGEFVVELDAEFTPQMLHVNDSGTTTVHLNVSHYDRADVDPDTVSIVVDGEAIDASVTNCGPSTCLFEFDAQDVLEAVGHEPGEYELRVTGKLGDGTPFEATATVAVVDRQERL